jgi:TPR repeat protein
LLRNRAEWNQAAAYFKKSADLNDPQAQHAYAIMLFGGVGVPMDGTQGASYFLRSISQNYPPAQCEFGTILIRNGDEVVWRLGAECIKRAADQGDSDAQYRFGLCLANGTGVEASDSLACAYLERVAYQNHIEAQFQLGKMLIDCPKAPGDQEFGTWHIFAAGDNGHMRAQLTAAQGLEEIDLEAAVRYYKMDADKGSPGRRSAMLNALYEGFKKGTRFCMNDMPYILLRRQDWSNG